MKLSFNTKKSSVFNQVPYMLRELLDICAFEKILFDF